MNPTEKKYDTPPSKMTANEFVDFFGGVYEHSPWIPRYAWHNGIDEIHDTPSGLSNIMIKVVADASREKILDLINAHPDLSGKAAVDGKLTDESKSEQNGAGIDQCTAEEFERFERFNAAYKKKFNFPFIMAVTGSNRHQILEAFEIRLENDKNTEFRKAVSEINKIAKFRLEALANS